MTVSSSRRRMVLAGLLCAGLAPVLHARDLPTVEVWKSPTCGCCVDWVAHLRENGFSVVTHDTGNTGARTRLGMPRQYASCHTARMGDYVIEGHVPASDMKRLLAEAPDALGLAVPRMPVGSPGMDGPAYGGRVDPYDTLLVDRNGGASVFQSHGR